MKAELGLVYKFGAIGRGDARGAIQNFLESQTLRFASPSTQNDINEAVPNVGALLQSNMRAAAVNQYPNREAMNPRWGSMTENEFVQVMYDDGKLGTANKVGAVRSAWKVSHDKFRRFGILSLTESPENLLLWAHYAGGASGLCIGFDESAAVFQDSEYVSAGLRGIHKIRYSETRATFGAGSLEERLGEIVLTKSVDWQYERELRCIRELEVGQTAIFPSFEAKDIKEIIVGSNMPIESIERCIELQEAKFPHASLLVALPDPEHFKMRFYACPKGKYLKVALQDLPDDIPPLGI